TCLKSFSAERTVVSGPCNVSSSSCLCPGSPVCSSRAGSAVVAVAKLAVEAGQQGVGILLGEVGGAEHVDSAAPDGDRGGIGQPVRGGEHGLLAAVRPDQHDRAE